MSFFLSKHAVGVYRGEPCPGGWERADPKPFFRALEALKAPEIIEKPEGEATIKSYTVGYQGETPGYGFVIGRMPGGERFLARVEDDLADGRSPVKTLDDQIVRSRFRRNRILLFFLFKIDLFEVLKTVWCSLIKGSVKGAKNRKPDQYKQDQDATTRRYHKKSSYFR